MKYVILALLIFTIPTICNQELANIIKKVEEKYRGHVDMQKFMAGAKLDKEIKRQLSLFPGGGFIHPEQHLLPSQKANLEYYRKWAEAVQ